MNAFRENSVSLTTVADDVLVSAMIIPLSDAFAKSAVFEKATRTKDATAAINQAIAVVLTIKTSGQQVSVETLTINNFIRRLRGYRGLPVFAKQEWGTPLHAAVPWLIENAAATVAAAFETQPEFSQPSASTMSQHPSPPTSTSHDVTFSHRTRRAMIRAYLNGKGICGMASDGPAAVIESHLDQNITAKTERGARNQAAQEARGMPVTTYGRRVPELKEFYAWMAAQIDFAQFNPQIRTTHAATPARPKGVADFVLDFKAGERLTDAYRSSSEFNATTPESLGSGNIIHHTLIYLRSSEEQVRRGWPTKITTVNTLRQAAEKLLGSDKYGAPTYVISACMWLSKHPNLLDIVNPPKSLREKSYVP